MNWTDNGIVLSARRHGESSAIVQLLTKSHGRHAGLVRGGTGRKLRGVLQPGNEVVGSWKARLSEHLGTYTIELLRSRGAALLSDPDRLAGLSAACAVAELVLPEREPHPGTYEGMLALLDGIVGGDAWPQMYVRWEAGLLAELGFGLDLDSCAVTGSLHGLAFVSPRSGRAVSEEGASTYRDRLLKLPAFLVANGYGIGDPVPGHPDQIYRAISDGLALTGYFLERHVLLDRDRALPPARTRLVERFTRRTTTSSAI
ncbi:MAG: DNA repair protein RecO [Alphaproteobacteria bacterium]|nr:DNA repair protein RecO [Alphaproteobacteria bacterium]|tara:strand:+ start:6653 stop:7426 length:774 start_codon:yes stop_codon:yes gene_type:complete